MSTEGTIQHHIQAYAVGVSELMSDYTGESIILTSDGTVVGGDALEPFFEDLLAAMPDGFNDAFEVVQLATHGPLAVMVWKAEPWVSAGTNTFVVQDDAILYQTYAGHRPA